MLECKLKGITDELELIVQAAPPPDHAPSPRVDLRDLAEVSNTHEVITVKIYLRRISMRPIDPRRSQLKRWVDVRDREMVEGIPGKKDSTGGVNFLQHVADYLRCR